MYTQTSKILVRKIYVPLNCSHRISGIFDCMESALYVSVFHRPLVKTCTCTMEYSEWLIILSFRVQCFLPSSSVFSSVQLVLSMTFLKWGWFFGKPVSKMATLTPSPSRNQPMLKWRATFHQEFIASPTHKVFPKYYNFYHVLFAQFCIKAILICVMKGVYLVIVVWNDSSN